MCSCLRLDHSSSLPPWGDRQGGEESKRERQMNGGQMGMRESETETGIYIYIFTFSSVSNYLN